ERAPALVVRGGRSERDVVDLVGQHAQRALVQIDDPALPEGLAGKELPGLGALRGSLGDDANGPGLELGDLGPAGLVGLEVLGEDGGYAVAARSARDDALLDTEADALKGAPRRHLARRCDAVALPVRPTGGRQDEGRKGGQAPPAHDPDHS